MLIVPSWSHDNHAINDFKYRPQYYRQYHDYHQVYCPKLSNITLDYNLVDLHIMTTLIIKITLGSYKCS